jgi:competence protein ComEC
LIAGNILQLSNIYIISNLGVHRVKEKVLNKTWFRGIVGTLICFLLIFGIIAAKPFISKYISNSSNTKGTSSQPNKSQDQNSNSQQPTPNNTGNGLLKVHYIDVGQGDSILVQQGGHNMLIDTGTNASTDSLVSYLHSQNITKLNYLVLTHPHEDHIGGAAAVIKGFDIGALYMTKYTTTTKTYKDMVSAIKVKGLKPIQPALGSTFKLGDTNCIVYGPVNSNGKDLNTCSIVIKVTYGNTKFLFTGDTQTINEEGMIKKGYDLSADILKVGHHGSDASTSKAFLNKVNPKYAVISCGKNNDYGYPHKSTMDKLQAKNITVYRTDECGTVVCTSDGKNISFDINPGDYKIGVKPVKSTSSVTKKATSKSNISSTTKTNKK